MPPPAAIRNMKGAKGNPCQWCWSDVRALVPPLTHRNLRCPFVPWGYADSWVAICCWTQFLRLYSNHQGDQGHWEGHWGRNPHLLPKNPSARIEEWWRHSVRGCTQQRHAITQAANANRPNKGPLPGSFACIKRSWAAQHLETHGPRWAWTGPALTKP